MGEEEQLHDTGEPEMELGKGAGLGYVEMREASRLGISTSRSRIFGGWVHILFDGVGVDMSRGPLVQKQRETTVTGWLCWDWSDPSDQADTMNSFPWVPGNGMRTVL